MVRLSASQKNIIHLMKNGWEMGKSFGIDSAVWIQKDGLGKGGESKSIRITTWYALLIKGIIHEVDDKKLREKYELTQAGKQANVS